MSNGSPVPVTMYTEASGAANIGIGGDIYHFIQILPNSVMPVVEHQLQFVTNMSGEWKSYTIYGTHNKSLIFESPTEYDLPLAEGFTKNGGFLCRYGKDQFGYAHFSALVGGVFPANTITSFAHVPAGFRPEETIIRAGMGSAGSEYTNVRIAIYPDGRLEATADRDCTWVSFDLCYLAAS